MPVKTGPSPIVRRKPRGRSAGSRSRGRSRAGTFVRSTTRSRSGSSGPSSDRRPRCGRSRADCASPRARGSRGWRLAISSRCCRRRRPAPCPAGPEPCARAGSSGRVRGLRAEDRGPMRCPARVGGMASCCDPNGLTGMFDEKHARSKARRYRQDGLDAEARRIVEFLDERIAGRTILEVGGGIGAIQLELLRRGGAKAEDGEISPRDEAGAPHLPAERGVADPVGRPGAGFRGDRGRPSPARDAPRPRLAVRRAGAGVSAVRLESEPRGIARLTLARPDVKNAFDAQLIADLTRAVGEIDRDARAVILASEGDAFCAGADVAWMRSMAEYTREENLADSRALAAMYRVLYELPMPLVARVQGAAIGGGAGLVAVADIAVASTAAFFAFAEVRVGILPAVVSPYVVRKVGAARATALFVTGARIDATRAHEIGLVERLAEPAELDAAVGRVVDAILEGSPAAVKAAKRLVREGEGRPPAEVADLTVSRIADIRVSGEGQEGLRAFLEKRKPRW